MSADTESGLAVKQLLKMVASGHLTNQQFKQLAQNVIGYDEEVPIQLEEDEETEAQAQVTAPPGAPAAMAANPTATEAGGGKGDKENGEQDGGGGGGGGGGSDAEVEAGAASPTLPWDDDGLQAEVEVEEEQQPAKKQKSMVDGTLTSFIRASPEPRVVCVAFEGVSGVHLSRFWSRLREFQIQNPDQDLESFKSILSGSLTYKRGAVHVGAKIENSYPGSCPCVGRVRKGARHAAAATAPRPSRAHATPPRAGCPSDPSLPSSHLSS